ncbi:MAG: helix-turn-helix transcriptional regulator [Telmatospirillum sp.]|nr:helix-turn-helix transcriptional regulator [Telmatospirillum sp.]
MAIRFDDIGKRLRAFRLDRQLTAEQIAERLGVSRAAVYRIESGDVVKIDTLERLAEVLETSTASLLGFGMEYYASPVAYFERMRQVEEQSDQVIAHFPPLSYLLTSDQYSDYLRKTLIEALPANGEERAKAEAEVDTILSILDERKKARRRRGLSVVNFVTLPEIERSLKIGIIGHFAIPEDELLARRRAARDEVEHLIHLIRSEPMGVQIGLIEETLPTVAFQLFRTADRTCLGISPFRLGGELPNVRIGVAMLTAEEQPVRMYEQIANDLWRRAHKGADAIALLQAVLLRSGIDGAPVRAAS